MTLHFCSSIWIKSHLMRVKTCQTYWEGLVSITSFSNALRFCSVLEVMLETHLLVSYMMHYQYTVLGIKTVLTCLLNSPFIFLALSICNVNVWSLGVSVGFPSTICFKFVLFISWICRIDQILVHIELNILNIQCVIWWLSKSCDNHQSCSFNISN